MSNNSLGDFGLSPSELEEQMRIMRSIEQRRNVTSSSSNYSAANMNHSHTSSHNTNTNTHNNYNSSSAGMNRPDTGIDGATGRNYTRRNTPNEMSSGSHPTNRAQEEVQEDPITENEAPGPKLTSCPVTYSPDWEWISKFTKPLIWNNVGLNEGVSRSSRTKGSSSNSSGGYRLKEGGIVRGVKSGSEDENKRPVRCLGCNVMLWVDKDANLVSCPDCWSVSPVVTSSN